MIDNRFFDGSTTNYGLVKTFKYDMTILPWGSMEPHNFHLPYLTDGIIAYEISSRTATQAFNDYGLKCMVLPVVNLGSQNLGQVELPFCIHASYETQFGILKDIVSSMARQGQDKLLIINGHGGNSFKNMIRDLNEIYPSFLIVVSNWFDMVNLSNIFENPGNHADEVETSMILYFHPELVDMSSAGEGNYKNFKVKALRKGSAWTPRNWAVVSEDTGIGNPKKATAEKGEYCTKAVVDEYVQLIKELSMDNIYE